MAGRPRVWTPFQFVLWAREYEYADDGRIRDSSRNVLSERGSDFEVVMQIAGTTRTQGFPKREILAMEFFGYPPYSECVVCSKRFNDRIVHLNGNRADCSRDNLKYVASNHGRKHEFRCLKWAMETNSVPAYRSTASRKVIAQLRYEKRREILDRRDRQRLTGAFV